MSRAPESATIPAVAKEYGVPRKIRIKRTYEVEYWVISLILIGLAIPALLMFGEEWSSSARHAVLTFLVVLWFLAFYVGLFATARQRARHIGRQRRATGIYFTFENAVLTRHVHGVLDINIAVSEILRIEEFATALRVEATTGWKIYIPRDTIGYAELRAELDKVCPIATMLKSNRPRFLNVISGIAAVAVVSSLVLLPLVHEPDIRKIAAGVLVGSLIWQYLCAPLISLALAKVGMRESRRESHNLA